MKYSFPILSAMAVSFTAASQPITISVTDANQDVIADMVVYATPMFSGEAPPKNTDKLVIGQNNRKFSPYVAVTQRGSTADFENNDDITHHIYSVSGNNNFEFKIKSGETKTSRQFNSVEEVAMGCNIHDWMSGYVLVVDTPYYTKTDNNGLAQLNLNAEGEYQLTVWHPQFDTKENRMEQVINVSFSTKKETHWDIQLPNVLLQLPSQENQDDFDFLDEY